jgi:hypothetical protein
MGEEETGRVLKCLEAREMRESWSTPPVPTSTMRSAV